MRKQCSRSDEVYNSKSSDRFGYFPTGHNLFECHFLILDCALAYFLPVFFYAVHKRPDLFCTLADGPKIIVSFKYLLHYG